MEDPNPAGGAGPPDRAGPTGRADGADGLPPRSDPIGTDRSDGIEGPVAAFEAERARLVGLAYRVSGSLADAEDVVQEAWLRWSSVEHRSIERPAAWLTTVTTRLAVDRLRALSRRREDYPGPFLPEPVCTSFALDDDPASPAAVFERRESLEYGFMVVLDALDPISRAVFVLADVFKLPFSDIAAAVDRSPDACRQIASRARRKVSDARGERVPADEGLLGELVGAIAMGDIDSVISLLSPEVVLTSDGGPDRHAARRPVVTPERVARFLVNLTARVPDGALVGIEQVNAAPALVVRGDDTIVISAERDRRSGAVAAITMMLNPVKVRSVDRRVAII